MFERFTDRARKAMANANHNAHASGSRSIEPAHVLAALVEDRTSTARAIVEHGGIGAMRLLEELRPSSVSSADFSRLPVSDGMKATVQAAIEEARRAGDNYVGSEHLLLGVIREATGQLQESLAKLGISLERARSAWSDVRQAAVSSSSGPRPETLTSTRAPEPVGAYAYTRRVGNLLFVSGMGPRQRGSKDIPGVKLDAAGKVLDYDMATQVRAVFENVRICLEEAGSRFENIVDVTSFLTNMDRDFAVYNRIYAELFPPGPSQPCRTTIGVASLPTAGNAPIAFEVKVIATV